MRFLILFFLIFFAPVPVFAMSSTNYSILADTFDNGGFGSSTNYYTFGTIGEWEGGTTTSTNYGILGGYSGIWADSAISLTLGSSSVSLGTLVSSAVSSVSNIATVTTDYAGGYSLYLYESAGLASGSDVINDVTDGSVTAGSEEYGIRTSGTSGSYNSTDTSIISTWKSVATNAGAASSEQTTITFKASVGSDTPSGTYSHSVSVAAVAQF